MIRKFEVCCFNALSAINAQKAGADRVELCENYHDGGTTPSYGTIKYVRNKIDIDLYVMIRPRGGNFVYTEQEIDIMKSDIGIAKKLKVDGIVFGLLNEQNNLDMVNTKVLLDEAYPLPVTFHRAFDCVNDPIHTMELLMQFGVQRILTSGQKKTAHEGKKLIKELIDKSGDKIGIMPGSGINALNIQEIANLTGAKEFHFSAKRFIKTAGDPLDLSGKNIIADEEVIRETISQLL